jgi:hypothetical protein
MVEKGKVSTVLDGGKTVTATPYSGATVTIPLAVPTELIGHLSVNTPIVYVTFEDGTGVVLCRVDAKSGVALTAYSDGDAIVIGGA